MKTIRLYALLLVSSLFILNGCGDDDPEPTMTASNFDLTLDEHQMNGYSLGFIDASSDLGAVSFSTTGIEPAGAITISDISGEIKVANVQMFNYEINQRIDAIVSITDGTNTKNINVAITINDIDDIAYYLTTSKNAYTNATDDNWVKITESEYNALANQLLAVNKAATSDVEYEINIGPIESTVDWSFVNDNGHIIPVDNYVFAIKYHAITMDNDACNVMYATNSITGPYTTLGGDLPNHDDGEQYFVLKGSKTKSTAISYLAFHAMGKMKAIFLSGASYYAYPGLATDITLADVNYVWLYQGLSTDIKQWD